MRTQAGMTLVCFLFAMMALAPAQTRKAGLWELTTTTTWQQSLAGDPAGGTPHTVQFCVTQQYFDKYGAILPPGSSCRVTSLVKKANGITGELACTGTMTGKMSLESTYSDGEHATGKIHFTGSMKSGADNKPVEWTSSSSGVYKGADCGTVKPLPMRDE